MVLDGLLPFSGVPFVHLLERISHLFSWTSHKKTTDFVGSGLVVGVMLGLLHWQGHQLLLRH